MAKDIDSQILSLLYKKGGKTTLATHFLVMIKILWDLS